MNRLNYVAEAALAALAEIHPEDPAYIAEKRETFEGLDKHQAFIRGALIFDPKVWEVFMEKLSADGHPALARNSQAAREIARLMAQL